MGEVNEPARPVGAWRFPARPVQTSGVGWLVAAVLLVALTIWIFAGELDGPAVTITVVDGAVVAWLGGLDGPALEAVWRVLAAFSSWWVLNLLGIALLVSLLVLRRFRHLVVVLVIALLITIVTETVVGPIAQRPRPFGVDIRTGWGGWALPPLQLTFLAATLVAVLYTLVPEGRWRNIGKWAAVALVGLAALGRIALGAEAPTDVLVGVAIGVAISLLAFRLFVPNAVFPVTYRRGRSAHLDVTGERGQAIRRALEDQLGLAVEDFQPFGLAGSAGSTPLRITLKADPPSFLFGKLYARSHLRADRWYKLGRELMYGRLEDERPFHTVRRLVQQEDYALRLCRDAGLPSPAPYGYVELTPEREYLLVTEFFGGAVELGEAQVDQQVIDDGLGIVRRMWDAGLAHRDIKPANLLVRDRALLLIDVAFAQARPSPWRQAVDLANMMLCLALRDTPERVYEQARRQFTVEEITEAFAAARGLALPSQLRRMLRERGRDVHGEFVKLLPTPPDPIRIQRWSWRRIGLWALVLVFVLLVLSVTTGSIASNEANATPVNITNVSCTKEEPLWLEAQSVPSADLVPCLRALPAGWMVDNMVVNDGRSMLTLDHDRAGSAVAVIRLTATCNPAGADEVASDEPEARRYLRTEYQEPQFSITWFDTFTGGCITTRLSAPTTYRGQLTTEATALLDFRTRQSLQHALEQRSDGRLHLDPPR